MVVVYDDLTMTTYYIPEGNIGEFEKRIARLIKRATRLGSHLEYSISRDQFKDIEHEFINREHKKEKRWVRYYRVDVDGDRPRYDGWNFIGTLEHTDEGNVMRMVPNETAPEHYREHPPICEHCKLKRTRKDTYLVRHENGKVTQVGSGCLVDFLGHASPQALAQLATIWVNINELTEMAQDSHWLGGGGGVTREREDLMTFLGYVAEITLRDGFWSRAAVNRLEEKYGENARLPRVTAWRAAGYMHPSCRQEREEAEKFTPSAEAKQLAEDARNWALVTFGSPLPEDGDYDAIKDALLGKPQNADLSDFEHNLLVVAKGESCERRTFGIAAYLIQAYRKARNLIPERKKVSRPESQHIGTVGQRFSKLEVTCEKVFTWNSEEFGTGSLFKLITDEGNVLVWRTYNVSDENNMFEGHRYAINATVKKHGEYDREKQTELSRVKVILGIVRLPEASAPQPENLEPDDDFVPATLQLAAA